MKKVIILKSIVIAVVLSSCGSKSTTSDGATNASVQTLDTTKLAKGATFYQCPMDMEVLSDKPGSCSKCAMDLEKMEKN